MRPSESEKSMIGYKLFSLRRDGTLGPLFINRKQRLELGITYPAQDHPTKGYAHRPGWHVLAKKSAPHLSKKGRVWAKVEISDFEAFRRPMNQGGLWYLAKDMKIIEIL
jgi:hypothetical protein